MNPYHGLVVSGTEGLVQVMKMKFKKWIVGAALLAVCVFSWANYQQNKSDEYKEYRISAVDDLHAAEANYSQQAMLYKECIGQPGVTVKDCYVEKLNLDDSHENVKAAMAALEAARDEL